MEADIADGVAVSLYIGLKPNERVDLEVAAKAAIEWARTLKAASAAVDPEFDYRVVLIAAEPGSSRWFAKIERSPINRAVNDIVDAWQDLPIIVKLTAAMVGFVMFTAYPTYKVYFAEEGFTPTQLAGQARLA